MQKQISHRLQLLIAVVVTIVVTSFILLNLTNNTKTTCDQRLKSPVEDLSPQFDSIVTRQNSMRNSINEQLNKLQEQVGRLSNSIESMPNQVVSQSTSSSSSGNDAPLYSFRQWYKYIDTYPALNPQKPFTFYGQHKEDELMLKYFTSSDGKYLQYGTFIELGALDGVRYSNTKFYEDVLGWNGILIEADPTTFPMLVRNRPLPSKIHVAICEKEQTIEMVGSEAMAGRVDTQDYYHKEKWGKKGAAAPKIWKQQCVPMSKYVNDIERVDFFSIDVEGAEADVLKSFPFDQIKVYAVLIELNGREPEKDKVCQDHLRNNGFEFVEKLGYKNFNELWINKNNKNSKLN